MIALSLAWKFLILPFFFADFAIDIVDHPRKPKSGLPYVFNPTHHLKQTLDDRYWGGYKVFFKHLKPMLARHEAKSKGFSGYVKIIFEINCKSELNRLVVQNAPNDEFARDIETFLTSAKFRWKKCRSPFPNKIEFEVVLENDDWYL